MVGYRMNQHFTFPPQRSTTQAAEGVPRWRWTVTEVERMAAHGFFGEFDQFELLGGEIVPMMSPAGRRHETIRIRLGDHMAVLERKKFLVAPEAPFNLSPDTSLKPDILVHPRSIDTYDVQGPDAVLVIEVAETSLSYDLKVKLPIYALHGVREYWVINAVTLMTTVHRQPAGDSYADAREFSSTERLIPSLAPGLAVSLNELDLDKCRRR
jgi:Uma2 family endonuclease